MLIKYFGNFFLSLFGNSFYKSKKFSVKVRLKYFFFQKILRINGNIPWMVHFTSKVKGQKNIQNTDRNPGMSIGCYIDGRNGIEFGKNVWVGPDVKIISMNHDLKDYSKYVKSSPIKIGNDCWIGAGAIILPSVEIGDNTIIGAGAVVTKSFTKCNIIIAGNPARIIKEIKDK